MKIKMLRDKLGSNDGFTTKHFQKDEEYEVSDSLALSFIEDGVAEEAGSNPAPTYEVGEVYNIGEEIFLAVLVDGETEPRLKPVAELSDEQRQVLLNEGKLSEDGKAVERKDAGAAPRNRALGRAPRNRAIVAAPENR